MSHKKFSACRFFLGICLLIGGASCKPRHEQDTDGLKAGTPTVPGASAVPVPPTAFIPGLPSPFMGEYKGTSFDVYQTTPDMKIVTDPTTGLPVVRLNVPADVRIGVSVTIKDATGKQIGSTIPANNAELSFSFSTLRGTPWLCADAVRFLDLPPMAPGPTAKTQKCQLEITVTGDQGVAITVIGLDAAGKGMLSWTPAPKPPALAGALLVGKDDTDVLTNPHKRIGGLMETAFVESALKDASTEFKQNETANLNARNTCLRNMRAAAWLDIQAFYHCQFPLSIRDPFIRKLLDNAKAAKIDPNYANDVRANAATARCAGGPTGTTTADKINPFCVTFFQTWAVDTSVPFFSTKPEHIKQYAYIMFTVQGLRDFDLESESSVINKFYGVDARNPATYSKRPRRLLDTFPSWLPNQPRYDRIRKVQAENIVR